MLLNECDNRVKDLLEKNKILENPLIRNFLNDIRIFTLFKEAVLNPTKENREQVEREFKSCYQKIRLKAYLTKLIKYSAIDYDKRVRLTNGRFLPILDAPKESENGTEPTNRERTIEEIGVEDAVFRKLNLEEEISNKDLYKSLCDLSDKQYQIINLIYVKGLSVTEASKVVGSTPQNIANIHRRTLKKLQKSILGGK